MSPLGGDPCHPVSNHDFMVIELGDFHISDDRNKTVQELTGISRHVNEIGRVCELQLNPEKKISSDIMGDKMCCANGKLRDDESVVETDVIQSGDVRTQVNYTTLATLEVGNSGLQECNGEVDSSIRFPFPQLIFTAPTNGLQDINRIKNYIVGHIDCLHQRKEYGKIAILVT
ncbi:hypothetical protein PR048_011274 [Dryococelus australis]|uniref:Uncharacterized protein n=1 Tax=Dryococelus australis TaxID=614101 RepID=A0ABQ9HL51_9NEOP|nr:hypothetical protein PR048_011274 [Dryococelus australis]